MRSLSLKTSCERFSIHHASGVIVIAHAVNNPYLIFFNGTTAGGKWTPFANVGGCKELIKDDLSTQRRRLLLPLGPTSGSLHHLPPGATTTNLAGYFYGTTRVFQFESKNDMHIIRYDKYTVSLLAVPPLQLRFSMSYDQMEPLQVIMILSHLWVKGIEGFVSSLLNRLQHVKPGLKCAHWEILKSFIAALPPLHLRIPATSD